MEGKATPEVVCFGFVEFRNKEGQVLHRTVIGDPPYTDPEIGLQEEPHGGNN